MEAHKGKRWVLFTKTDGWCQSAAGLASAFWGDRVEVFHGRNGDPFPDLGALGEIHGVVSYLSPWIVPKTVLDEVEMAINFHPGSCDYPGIGCYNFALYEGAPEYGAVCHHMAPAVDTGGIIMERLFTVAPGETVEGLKLRTMVVMLDMFHELLPALAAGQAELPRGAREWMRRPFLRRELNELCVLSPEMAPAEVERRIRATVYPGQPGPVLRLWGHDFTYPVPDRSPLA